MEKATAAQIDFITKLEELYTGYGPEDVIQRKDDPAYKILFPAKEALTKAEASEAIDFLKKRCAPTSSRRGNTRIELALAELAPQLAAILTGRAGEALTQSIEDAEADTDARTKARNIHHLAVTVVIELGRNRHEAAIAQLITDMSA